MGPLRRSVDDHDSVGGNFRRIVAYDPVLLSLVQIFLRRLFDEDRLRLGLQKRERGFDEGFRGRRRDCEELRSRTQRRGE